MTAPAASAAPSATPPTAAENGVPSDGAPLVVVADVAVVAPADESPTVPRDTTPTWEIELLVSGIVLVGLMQIPAWLHDVWVRRAPHLSIVGVAGGAAGLLALDAAVYALVGCFLVHLALRGYWVALVGANSVFPHGVRWDRQREYGPIQADIVQRRVRPLPTFIARADNAASLVFATGFVLAASTLSSIAFILVLVLLIWALTAVVPLTAALITFGVLGGGMSALAIGAAVLDMRRGDRLAPGGRTARGIRAILKTLSGLTPDGVRSLGAVLTSNIDKRVVYAAGFVGLGGAYLAANSTIRDDEELPGASNYTFFAEDARPGVVTADNYASLASDAPGYAALGAPSIQSDVITDPYIRLFVPYRPSRHDAALRRACPGLQPPPDDRRASNASAASTAVLTCAERVHAVTLDGRPVAGAHFRFFTNPRTERRGFLMLIPATNLAPGEHVLTVQPARRDPTPSDTAPVRIPFWH